MIDYTVLKVIWWMLIGIVLIIYACTAGFDAGVTMYMPFLRKEGDRRVVLNTSAPTWDGNFTWIVFAGGGLFVVWPVVYSMAFSGMYAAMLIILFSLFLRPPSFEYRSKVDNPRWRRMCDWGLFISGVVPVFVFGVAFGNCFLGFPFHFQPHTLRQFYTGGILDLFSPFAVIAGLTSVTMSLMHGSVFLQRRTEGHIRKLAFKVHVYTAVILLALFTVAGLMLLYHIKGFNLVSSPADPTRYPLNNVVTHSGSWIDSYMNYPMKFFPPVIAYAGILESLWAAYYGWLSTAFWASCCAVGGIIGTAGFTLFPFIMPSSTTSNESLTVWNSVSSQYALNIMLYVGVVLLFIILGYKIFAYHTIWAKKSIITHEDIEKDSHTYY